MSTYTSRPCVTAPSSVLLSVLWHPAHLVEGLYIHWGVWGVPLRHDSASPPLLPAGYKTSVVGESRLGMFRDLDNVTWFKCGTTLTTRLPPENAAGRGELRLVIRVIRKVNTSIIIDRPSSRLLSAHSVSFFTPSRIRGCHGTTPSSAGPHLPGTARPRRSAPAPAPAPGSGPFLASQCPNIDVGGAVARTHYPCGSGHPCRPGRPIPAWR